MRVYNPKEEKDLSPGLSAVLNVLRARRAFDAGAYVAAKSALLNSYLRESNLKSCVVGVSGGIDSAVVLALSAHAARQENSPIRRIVPMLLPVHVTGASGQDSATRRGRDVLSALGMESVAVDLTAAHTAIKMSVDGMMGMAGEGWASGQLVAYARTPALYYATSLLSQAGLPGIVLGTTNRDEGAYLGYVGKASDGMVDVQLISDLHKSEVYAVAEYLDLPASVITAVPTGDMYDARVDTEVFGAEYDFVELFLGLKCLPVEKRGQLTAGWSSPDKAQYERLAENLEKLHRYNAHKYKVGSPAVHLDIYESAVPDGWTHGPKPAVWKDSVDTSSFAGPFSFSDVLVDKISASDVVAESENVILPDRAGNAVVSVKNIISARERGFLLDELARQEWVPAGMNGMRGGFDPQKEKTGSWRASSYAPRLAAALWDRIAPFVPAVIHAPAGSSASANGAEVWRAVGVSPLLRFIKYVDDGMLVAHYDAPFDEGNGRRTLKSMVVYLAGNAGHGATRFIRDPQEEISPLARDYSDWSRTANPDEVLLSIAAEPGNAIVFDHRLLHDSEPLGAGAPMKIILRTDIVYERIVAP